MTSRRDLREVEEMALQLTPTEQLTLVERIAHNVRTTAPVEGKRLPISLRDKFRSPETDAVSTADVERALHEIRSEWLSELADSTDGDAK